MVVAERSHLQRVPIRLCAGIQQQSDDGVWPRVAAAMSAVTPFGASFGSEPFDNKRLTPTVSPRLAALYKAVCCMRIYSPGQSGDFFDR